MNKLDAISRRGKGTRALVRLIKIAITGCSACMLIASSSHLRLGGMTYALDDNSILTGPTAASVCTPEDQSKPLPFHAVLNEDEILSLFPEEKPKPPVYERPSLSRPDGWTGNAVTTDTTGKHLLYGEAIPPRTGMTESCIPTVSGRVPSSYFSEDTVFIGNSLVVGMQKVSAIDTTYYATIGMSVNQFFDKPLVASPDGEKDKYGAPVFVSPAEALVRCDNFKRVYLMFGVNELGWSSITAFINQYEAIIDFILAVRADAVIYVQGLLPVNEAVYQSANATPLDCITNARIAQFNERLFTMAQRKQVVFLNPGEALADASGQLPANATADGIHLNGALLRKWADYLYTHTVEDVDPALFYEDNQ